MSEQVVPQSQETGGQQTSAQPSAEAARPSFKDVLKNAAEQGAPRQEMARQKWKDRFSAAREKAGNAWKSVKETGRTIDATVRGLVNNPDLRQATGDIVRDRIEQGREVVRQKTAEISAAASDKKDAAIQGFQDRMRSARDAVAENVVRPVVDRANAIGTSIAETAAAGKLFAKDTKDASVATAKRWGNRLSSFMSTQAENVGTSIQSGKDTVVAKYHESKAKAGAAGREAYATMNERSAARSERRAKASLAKSRQRTERARDMRGRAAELRSTPASGAGRS